MANIISEDTRRAMQSAARARFILAGAMVALICAGISFLVLLPSYFVLLANSKGISATPSAVSPSERASDTAAITHTKALVGQLAPLVAASSSPTEAITAALGLRPSGVRVDQISYSSGTPASLMLVGSADTTSDISAYRAALSADPLFTSVSVPVGALVGTDGGRFSITISGTF